jgi:putative transposase
MVEQMRQITDTATRSTRQARRDRARRPAPTSGPPPQLAARETDAAVPTGAVPFTEIEEW